MAWDKIKSKYVASHKLHNGNPTYYLKDHLRFMGEALTKSVIIKLKIQAKALEDRAERLTQQIEAISDESDE